MKTLYTIVFIAAFFVPSLFVMYGVFLSLIALFVVTGYGDYPWFLGSFSMSIGGGMGVFSVAQLLDLTFNDKAKIMRPLWTNLFLLAGLLSLIFSIIILSIDINVLAFSLLLMPTLVSLFLIFVNREYLWVRN